MIPAGAAVKYKDCHMELEEKLTQFRRQGAIVPTRGSVKTPEQIRGIKGSARINVAVLDCELHHIGPGITTAQIDLWVCEQTTRLGGIPRL